MVSEIWLVREKEVLRGSVIRKCDAGKIMQGRTGSG